ncbi:MAG TPA: hypothetical protein PK668_20995 [Myxococcota bacterium]|nr:hypothetical protein [Myxococcota bacterium]HRY96610.1 hypothetical protein [Myxococcota bacterium]
MAKQNEDEAGTLGQAAAAERFLEDPPWYARFAPKMLWKQCRLLVRMVGDYFSGDYT